jgi:hypothetical protein
MATQQEKARKARNLATEQFGGVDTYKTRELVNKNAKAAGKKLTGKEETRAAKIMQTRRQNDRDRTAARGAFVTGPNSPASKRASAARVTAAVAGPARKIAAKKKTK